MKIMDYLENHKDLLIGCVADDFTGASDIASFFSLGGLNVLLVNGIPKEDYNVSEDIQVIVIALKTRNIEVYKAINESLNAFKWLRNIGSKQLFFKYCSTFDSTKEGNIGPVIDALLEYYNIRYTIISPALPVNGRTVVDGCIYVNGLRLNQSSMKNHPLTPMWSCSISELMANQGKYKVYNLTIDEINKKKLEVDDFISDITSVNDVYFYIAPDFYEENHAKEIVEIFGKLPLLTGSSGLAYELSKIHTLNSKVKKTINRKETDSGRGIVLSGSCSKTTGVQINDFLQKSGHALEIDPNKLLNGSQDLEDLLKYIYDNPSDVILVYSYDSNVNKVVSAISQTMKSKILEETMSKIAKSVLLNGFTKIVVAGGETSGAVTKSLGFDTYIIGDSISPGVPILIPESNKEVGLVLKSGNFGEADFFTRAMVALGGKIQLE